MSKVNEKPVAMEKKSELWAVIIPAIVTITVALIGLAGTLATLIFSLPGFQELFKPSPTYTATTSAIETVIQTPPDSPPPALTEVFTPAPPTEILSPTFTPSLGLPTGMQVILVANRTQGKAPLPVRFDARDSFLRTTDGTIFECGACNYTWSIRKGEEYVLESKKTDGTFEYKFGAKGTYFVSVVVCRSNSNDCAGSGASILVE